MIGRRHRGGRNGAGARFIAEAEAAAEAPGARRRAPLLVEDGLEAAAHTPHEAPPPPETGGALPDNGATARAIRAAAAERGSLLMSLTLAALTGLVTLAVTVAVYDLVFGLIARNPVLGWTAAGLVGLVGLAGLAFAVREIAATARLARVDAIRDGAAQAARTGDRRAALRAVRSLRAVYRRRRDLDWALADARGREDDLLDAAALLADYERTLLKSLDARAEAAVGRSARSVAMITALVPITFVDIIAALTVNLRMIREIAEVYGGRAGWVGSWRLLKAVAAHLIATGAVSLGDDMLGPVVGGGVLARLSRRFGEGLVNGALTARVGAAAMEVCRPLPFAALPRPSASKLAASALRGIVGGGARAKGATQAGDVL